MSAAPKVALVFCVHHKPWLMMATALTTLLQDVQDADWHVLYQLGDGACPERPSYRDYHALAAAHGADPQLSPFDERVREVCAVAGRRIVEHGCENDGALDSGAWYTFLRGGAWREYDYIVTVGEGTLWTSPRSLSAMLAFAARRGAHFIASGHEQRRRPKSAVLRWHADADGPSPMREFHDRMIAAVFEVFCRDPEFRALYDAWPSDGAGETQDHVPDIWGGRLAHRLRAAVSAPENGHRSAAARLKAVARLALARADWMGSWTSIGFGGAAEREAGPPLEPSIHVDGRLRPRAEVVACELERGVAFHRVAEPEWFGCATNHLFSRELLERFTERIARYGLREAVELPFAGSALEIVWGFLPAWLGCEKWFTDAMHRVRKHFVTYRREDDPAGMASYINRYHRGRLCVRADGERIVVSAAHASYRDRLRALPACYWAANPLSKGSGRG